jgi:aryl-alcohol dehydrogenase-like predicted oxidoreductase
MPRFMPESLPHNLEILHRLDAIAAEKGCSLAQLALAWLLAQGDDVVPIVGTKQVARLEENIAATRIQLSPHDVAAINTICTPGVFLGERLSPSDMARIAG